MSGRACPTPHKHSYSSRRKAKLARSRFVGVGEARDCSLRPYPCVCGMFHLGHLANAVIRGDVSRADMYGPA